MKNINDIPAHRASVNIHLAGWLKNPTPSDPMAIFDDAPDLVLFQPADSRHVVTVEFDYPLDEPLTQPIELAGGTVADFVTGIAKAYERIYAEEAEDGRHAIWSHSLGDLFLEGFYRRPDGIWALIMGS